MLRKNDTLITEIIDMNMLGFGIAKPDGFAVFVSGAIPGDRARIRIIKVQKKLRYSQSRRNFSPPRTGSKTIALFPPPAAAARSARSTTPMKLR